MQDSTFSDERQASAAQTERKQCLAKKRHFGQMTR